MTIIDIPANDAFSLNSHSHRRASRHTFHRSQTHSPPPKVSFFASSTVPLPNPVEKESANGMQGVSMSLRHRSLNGKPSSPVVSINRERGHQGLNDDDRAKESRKIDWEIPRKVLHSSIGFLVVPLYTLHTSTTKVALVLSFACVIIGSVDFVRFRNPRFAAIYEKGLGFLMRESEKRKTTGVIWYLLGCIFVLTFYPQDIAVVSILILSWCDTAASFFGRLYGLHTRPLPQFFTFPFTSSHIPLPFAQRKSLAGFLAGTATGALIAFGFWGWLAPFGSTASSLPKVITMFGNMNMNPAVPAVDKLSIVAVTTGLLAGIAEAIDIGSLDDNLTLPIISGGIIWAIFKLVDYVFP
ncbi:hypothetical protein DFH11DRAFT_1608669 [Phellopilus nigrolimitatus]|nr:hypothetical protein DFH11DRAFT_1608669 [Phellopilus nigrolimitatus]